MSYDKQKGRFAIFLSLMFSLLICNCYGGFFSSSGGVIPVWKGRSFSTLKDLKHYANSYSEFPEMDNSDPLNPDYSSFFKSRSKGYFKKAWHGIKSWWSKSNAPSWSPGVLNKALKNVVKLRQENLRRGDFLEKFTPPKDAKFVMWSGLHGSYHSLVRGLDELHKQEILDNNLSISDKKTYFVFNGNAVNFSPYSMETLTAILLLMEKNPDNVFYVKGRHETDKFWNRYGLVQELQGKIKKTKDFVSFKNGLKDFFNTLPLALYLRKKTDIISQFIQISSNEKMRYDGISPQKEFLYAPDYGKPQIYKLTKNMFNKSTEEPDTISIDLFIDSDNGFHSLLGKKGLRKKVVEGGVPYWSIFSGQTRTHRTTRNFFYDSFVVFSLNDVLTRSTLSLYARDNRNEKSGTDKGFEKVTYMAIPKERQTTKHLTLAKSSVSQEADSQEQRS